MNSLQGHILSILGCVATINLTIENLQEEFGEIRRINTGSENIKEIDELEFLLHKTIEPWDKLRSKLLSVAETD